MVSWNIPHRENPASTTSTLSLVFCIPIANTKKSVNCTLIAICLVAAKKNSLINSRFYTHIHWKLSRGPSPGTVPRDCPGTVYEDNPRVQGTIRGSSVGPRGPFPKTIPGSRGPSEAHPRVPGDRFQRPSRRVLSDRLRVIPGDRSRIPYKGPGDRPTVVPWVPGDHPGTILGPRGWMVGRLTTNDITKTIKGAVIDEISSFHDDFRKSST